MIEVIEIVPKFGEECMDKSLKFLAEILSFVIKIFYGSTYGSFLYKSCFFLSIFLPYFYRIE